jgi:hypothetical protein
MVLLSDTNTLQLILNIHVRWAICVKEIIAHGREGNPYETTAEKRTSQINLVLFAFVAIFNQYLFFILHST